MKQFLNAKNLALGAMIAALYVVLTVVFEPISFGPMQCRVSELLTILPLFTPAAILGLFVGCLIGNLVGGALLLDVILGPIATLLAAILTYVLRTRRPVALLMPVICNALIVGPYLPFLYSPEIPVIVSMLAVALGEVIVCFALGLPAAKLIDRIHLFPSTKA